MQLTVDEAARVLKVPEDMIYQWIRNDQLPANRFGSRYRINRVKLIEWAYQRGIAMEIQGGIDQPVLENALLRGNPIQTIDASDLRAVYRQLIEGLAKFPRIDTGLFLDFIAMRKNCGMVLGPQQIAVPEVRSPNIVPVPEPIVEIAYLQTPVPIGNSRCSTMFAIFAPTATDHLDLLTRILCIISDRASVTLLQNRASKEALLGRLREFSVLNTASKSKTSMWHEVD